MQKRIIVGALLSVLLMLLSLGIVSSISVDDEMEHALRQSLELASITANYTDHLLQVNLARLYDVSLSGTVNFADGNWEPERQALKTAYEYSIFTDGLFLLDKSQNIMLAYPHRQISGRDLEGIPDVAKAFQQERPFLTSIHELSGTGRKAIFAFAPLKNQQGHTIGVIGGEVDPTNTFIRDAIRAIRESHQTVIELIDGNGVVIASSHPQRVFVCSDRKRVLADLIRSGKSTVLKCHRCHEGENEGAASSERTTDRLAFASLQEAPWGVSVREPETEITAPSADLRKRFLILGIIISGTAFMLALGLSKSIVNPIRELTLAARRIAEGHLETPVRTRASDEIQELTTGFESMRVKLAQSLESIRQSNQQLERRVEERTCQLEESRGQLLHLLHKIMNVQEDERKRIARGLHDETIQATAALGLSIEIASLKLREGKLAPGDLLKLKAKADQLIDGINALIQDLRPPMLDDLGLESAIRWLLDKHLQSNGIEYRLEVSPGVQELIEGSREKRLEENRDLLLFRIVQEAVINVARHSGAARASVRMTHEDGRLQVVIQDNGTGFAVDQAVIRADSPGSQGYGLLGLRERVDLLGGKLQIDSTPGAGTRLSVSIPAKKEECLASR